MTALVSQENTKASLTDIDYQPVNNEPFQYSWLAPDSHTSPSFVIFYIKDGDRVIEPPYSMPNEIGTLSSLTDIGKIIFKNSRSISITESAAMHSYFKKKYKKIPK